MQAENRLSMVSFGIRPSLRALLTAAPLVLAVLVVSPSFASTTVPMTVDGAERTWVPGHGDVLFIYGDSFGPSAGGVRLAGEELEVLAWSGDLIEATFPENLSPGTYTLDIDGRRWWRFVRTTFAVTPQGGGEGGLDEVGLDDTVLTLRSGEQTFTVDLSGLVDDGDADAANELLDSAVLNGALLELTEGGGLVSVDLSALIDDADADPDNERVTSLALTGTTLVLTEGGTSFEIDLAPLRDGIGTDDQALTFDGTTLSIEDGNSVDLSGLRDGTGTDDQLLMRSGDVLTLENGGSVDLADLRDGTGTDAQLLSRIGDQLTLENGGTVDLADLRTPEQTLALDDNGTLTIAGGNSVDLSALADGTGSDDQTLALEGAQLSIEGGNAVDLSALADGTGSDDQALTRSGDVLTLEDGGSVDLADLRDGTGSDDQTLALEGAQLSIEGGNAVDLSELADGTGSDDQALTRSGDVLTLEDGGSVDLADLRDGTGSDDQTLALEGAQLSIEGGNAVDLSALADGTGSDDQALTRTGDVLTLEDGGSVDLGDLRDGTGSDDQTLALEGAQLSIEGGNAVDLSALADGTGSDDQALTRSGDVLTLEDGGSVDLGDLRDGTGSDDQALTRTGDVLTLEDGGSVDLGDLRDGTGTDDQGLTLVGDVLSIEGGNSVSLAAYLDDTDDQTLTLTGTTLSISGGNGVNLAGLRDGTGSDDQTLTRSGDTLSIEGGNSVSLADLRDNTDSQTLAFDGTNLGVSGGNSVSLAALRDGTGTDDQTLTLNGSALSIEGGNSVDLAALVSSESGWLAGDDIVTTTASVGVGVDAPEAALHVAGDVLIDGVIRTAPDPRRAQRDAFNQRSYAGASEEVDQSEEYLWQSLTITVDGVLTAFEVRTSTGYFSAGDDGMKCANISIRRGEGLTGQRVFTSASGPVASSAWRRFDLATPIPVAAGEQLSIIVTAESATCFAQWALGNDYAGGRGVARTRFQNGDLAAPSDVGDFQFRTEVTSPVDVLTIADDGALAFAAGAITATLDGKIGIGTASPATLLDVAGTMTVQGDLRLGGAIFDADGDVGAAGQVLTSDGSRADWGALDERGLALSTMAVIEGPTDVLVFRRTLAEQQGGSVVTDGQMADNVRRGRVKLVVGDRAGGGAAGSDLAAGVYIGTAVVSCPEGFSQTIALYQGQGPTVYYSRPFSWRQSGDCHTVEVTLRAKDYATTVVVRDVDVESLPGFGIKTATNMALSFDDEGDEYTELDLSNNSCSGNIPLGFNLNAYGASTSTVKVSDNGVLFFGTDCDNSASNHALPVDLSDDPMLFFFWDDLRDYGSGEWIRYATRGSGTKKVFSLRVRLRLNGDCGSDALEAQVAIHEQSGLITVTYQTVPSCVRFRGSSATFGLQAAGGGSTQAFTTVGHNVPLLDDNNDGSLFMSFTPE